MFPAIFRSTHTRKNLLISVCMLIMVVMAFSTCISCNSISGDTSNKKDSKEDKWNSSESGRDDHRKKLEELLGNPSFTYVSANQTDGGATAVIESKTDTKIASIAIGAKGGMIAMHPEGKIAYVTGTKSNKIFVIDTENNKLIKTIESKDEPYGIASNPNGKEVYVTHHKSNYISILDTDKNKLTDTIEVKQHPCSIAVSFDGLKAVVGHGEYSNYQEGQDTKLSSNTAGSKDVSIIDLEKRKIISNITTKGSTWGVAFKSDGSQILATTYEPYIGSFSDFEALGKWGDDDWNGITVIDAKKNKITLELQIPEHIVPRSVAYTPKEDKAYIIGSGSDEAHVLDIASLKITNKIPLGLGG